MTCVSVWVRLRRVACLRGVGHLLRVDLRRHLRRRHRHGSRRELARRHRSLLSGQLLLREPLVARRSNTNIPLILLLLMRLLAVVRLHVRQGRLRGVEALLGLGCERLLLRLHRRFSMVGVRFGVRRGRLVVRQI